MGALRSFLTTAQRLMPGGEYQSLVELLVKFDHEAISMTQLLADVMALLKKYPKLQDGFHPFLPPTWTLSRPGQV